jgi:hypothetical protein
MKTRANTKRIGALALATLIATVAIPVAAASTSTSDPGLVARKLGSPDPRENVTKTQYAPGQIASRLGSPDPRETGLDRGEKITKEYQQEMRNDPINRRRMGGVRGMAGLEASQASRASSAVATSIGSPDPQDAARLATTDTSQVSGSFDWGDFAIGLAFGIGIAAIVAGVLVLTAVAARGRSVAQPLS